MAETDAADKINDTNEPVLVSTGSFYYPMKKYFFFKNSGNPIDNYCIFVYNKGKKCNFCMEYIRKRC